MGPRDLRQHIQSTALLARRTIGLGPAEKSPKLVQEEAGIRISISPDLPAAAQQAAGIMAEKYRSWWERERFSAWGHYKRQHFTIAVGGGNTVKAQYHAMVEQHFASVDWVNHVRFFFLEESTGEADWESPEQSLINHFISPLTRKLIKVRGLRALAQQLQLGSTADADDVVHRMVKILVNPINLARVKQALKAGNHALAVNRARNEAERYQRDIQNKLGATMEFHYIISGIGKNGTLGVFEPYMRELAIKEPRAIIVRRGPGALRVALNRGVLINGESISLIVSGHLKLRALGRFEMAESTDFEQTVMETPLRMLRETYAIARKVCIFADETSLHFAETQFKYSEKGVPFFNKAETRKGEDSDAPHIFLLHGFMGLFSFTNFLVRLPSAWTVSALHRGSRAKNLASDDIFPHYARVLRQVILATWRQGKPTPIAVHSIAGVISDHLLLLLLANHDAPITPYAQLSSRNRMLVDALRASGIVHLAAWAPTDVLHTRANIKAVISYYRRKAHLDYTGFERVYHRLNDELSTTEQASPGENGSLPGLNYFLDSHIAEPIVGGLNVLLRSLLNNKSVQQKLLNINSPYVLRLVGNRLLKRASFYGLCKEINAALHNPNEYQRRHLRALDLMLEYDIPFLSIVHEDDFLVSAQRHKEEYEHLLALRKRKEGVAREADLRTTVRHIRLRRKQEELPLDPLNPHLMIIATSNESSDIARQITEAINRFVNENVDRATRSGMLKPVASVRQWMRENSHKPKRARRRLA
jgi:6-phosphogluconolactonase/glucosamine-6-phosphate isomerase/deaminase